MNLNLQKLEAGHRRKVEERDALVKRCVDLEETNSRLVQLVAERGFLADTPVDTRPSWKPPSSRSSDSHAGGTEITNQHLLTLLGHPQHEYFTKSSKAPSRQPSRSLKDDQASTARRPSLGDPLLLDLEEDAYPL